MREMLTEEDEVILFMIELENTDNRFRMITKIRHASDEVRLKLAARLQGSALSFFNTFI